MEITYVNQKEITCPARPRDITTTTRLLRANLRGTRGGRLVSRGWSEARLGTDCVIVHTYIDRCWHSFVSENTCRFTRSERSNRWCEEAKQPGLTFRVKLWQVRVKLRQVWVDKFGLSEVGFGLHACEGLRIAGLRVQSNKVRAIFIVETIAANSYWKYRIKNTR